MFDACNRFGGKSASILLLALAAGFLVKVLHVCGNPVRQAPVARRGFYLYTVYTFLSGKFDNEWS
jgi:hypothetical protein